MDSRQRYESRLARFIDSPRWKQEGKELHIKQKGVVVQVVPIGTQFKVRMNEHLGKSEYKTEAEAKAKAFEALENGKAEKYLNAKKKKA